MLASTADQPINDTLIAAFSGLHIYSSILLVMPLDLFFLPCRLFIQGSKTNLNKQKKKKKKMADVNKKFKLSVNMAKEPHLDPDWFQAISDMKVKGEHAEQHTQMI